VGEEPGNQFLEFRAALLELRKRLCAVVLVFEAWFLHLRLTGYETSFSGLELRLALLMSMLISLSC
jgi:hypothetical protein